MESLKEEEDFFGRGLYILVKFRLCLKFSCNQVKWRLFSGPVSATHIAKMLKRFCGITPTLHLGARPQDPPLQTVESIYATLLSSSLKEGKNPISSNYKSVVW